MPDISTLSDRPGGLQMVVPARTENVAVIRHAIAGMAEEIGMDEPGLADLKTIVTEACMNVVVHAYDGHSGPLTVEARPDDEGLTVTVSDQGAGIRPQADIERDSLRLGLSLIAALSSSFSISGGIDRGTEVSMRVPLRGGGAAGRDDSVEMKPDLSDRTELTIDRTDLLAPVLSRVVGALAARRELSVDQVSDATLVTDAIAAAAPSRFADGRVRLGLWEGASSIDLSLGPMEADAAQRVRAALEVPDVGGSLESLADELSVEAGGDGEYLIIRFAAPPPAP